MENNKTEKFFDSYAGDFNAIYDGDNDIFRKIINRLFRRSMRIRFEKSIEGCGSDADKSVLDIGCGPGHYGVALASKGFNVTGIDLYTFKGKERIECILSACGKFNLPLIVHGGRSPILKNAKSSSYASINNLKNIDWSISKAPVILAHAGAFGCSINEVEDEIFPILKILFSSHSNLVIDISAIDIDILAFLIKRIGESRMLFGSDALYIPQWENIVKFPIITKISIYVNAMFWIRVTVLSLVGFYTVRIYHRY